MALRQVACHSAGNDIGEGRKGRIDQDEPSIGSIRV